VTPVKPIDSVLRIMVQDGATELRLASDRAPQMFRGDIGLPLTIPATSTKMLLGLLDDLWTSRAPALREGGVSFSYASDELGTFAVTLEEEAGGGLKVSFRRDGATAMPGTDAVSSGCASTRAISPAPLVAGSSGSGARKDALPADLIALLARAASMRASDVHLGADRPPIVRVDGELRILEAAGAPDPAALVGASDELAQVRGGRSVDRAVDVDGVGRLRVNVYASDGGLCAAVRILCREAPALRDLDLPGGLESLVDLPHGLVIVCGPTGSGKSTTLAALAQQALRVRARVLISLEDPIEYLIRPGREAGLVRQREIGTHARDFATGLRDALREDPDILLVGEMRDPETISLALTAAETGHLVLASLHSRTAASAVERIVDTYPPERQRQIRVQLADALRAVVSQRLVAKASGRGRVAAVELLKVTYAVANLIRDGRTAQIASALQASGDGGMLPLERSLADLVRAGTIARETAAAVANDASTLAEYLRSPSPDGTKGRPRSHHELRTPEDG
jgi:twitching motility protein PilT